MLALLNIIIMIVLYRFLESSTGGVVALVVALFVGLINASLIFSINRPRWEHRVINNLPFNQREEFLDRTTKEAARIVHLAEIAPVVEPNVTENLLLIALVKGLVGDISSEEEAEILSWFDEAGRDPLNRALIAMIDGKYAKRYRDYYRGFQSSHGEVLTSSIPLARMYRRSIKKLFLPMLESLRK